MQITKNILSNNDFWILNKKLVKSLGAETTLLLSYLVTKYKYFEARGEVEDGWFFNTQDNIEEDTGISAYRQRSAFDTLEQIGFIERKIAGIPARQKIRIIDFD